ncbi:hypothetical protein TNCV_669561 [Trichonephila clavipes]|nr:hypothetical protein TNCV_669561 [Trichonephila clavipes]
MLVRLSRAPVLSGGLIRKTQLFSGTLYMAASSKTPPHQSKAKRNRRVTFTRVTSIVTASFGNAISAATVRRRLHMNGLYARVPRVCVPLSVQRIEEHTIKVVPGTRQLDCV